MKRIMENFRKFIDAGGEAPSQPEEVKQAVATITYFLGYLRKLTTGLDLYGRPTAGHRPVELPKGMHELFNILKSMSFNTLPLRLHILDGDNPHLEVDAQKFYEIGSRDAEDNMRHDAFVALLGLENMFFQEVTETGMSFDSAVETVNLKTPSQSFHRYSSSAHEDIKERIKEISNIVKNDNEAQAALDDFMHDTNIHGR